MHNKKSSRQNDVIKSYQDNAIGSTPSFSDNHFDDKGKKERKDNKRRSFNGVKFINILTVLSIAAAIVILINLNKIQINDSDTYVLAGASQQFIMQENLSKRGDIYDSNGVLLATSSIKYTIGVTPRDARSLTRKVTEHEIAVHTASTLGLPLTQLTDALEQKDKSYIQLLKSAPEETAETLRTWLSENRVGSSDLI